MRAPILTLVVPNALNGGRLEVRSAQLQWSYGVDVTLPVVVVNQDGTAYSLAGAVSALLSFYACEGGPREAPTLQVEWTITGENTAEFYVTRDMAPILPITDRGYAVGVRFRDDDVGAEDQVLLPGRVLVMPQYGDFGAPVTVPPSQQPLARGPGIVWRGSYDPAATYQPLDAVSYASGGTTSSYICTATTVGNVPTDADFWDLMVTGSGTGLPDPTDLPQGTVLIVDVTDDVGAWSSRQLSADDIAPGFAIASASFAGTGVVECGVSVASVSLTASYTNGPPTSANLTDGTNTDELSSPFTSGSLDNAGAGYEKSAPGSTTFTLSATKSTTKTASAAITWEARNHWGIAAAGTYDSAFILALPSSGLAAGFAGTYAIGAGGGTEYAFLAFPTAEGTPSSFKDAGTGFAVPMTKVASSVAVTNAHGAVIDYDLWASSNPLSSAFNLQVS